MSWTYRFSVFTPTYNRAHTLPRVYEALGAQTFRDFEWLIVDDGSTDNTESLVSSWARVAPFPVNYLRKANGGKHSAFNAGSVAARGELFLNLDSDDSCMPHALERFDWHWRQIPDRSRFSGVTALCVDSDGHTVGDRFPADVFDSDSLEITHRYHIRGEKWGFQRTDVMRRFPFPDAPPRTYVGEGIIWARIAREFKTRFVNEALRTYFHDPTGRLMNRPIKIQAASAPFYLTYIRENLDWLARSPRYFLGAVANYNRYNLHTDRFLSSVRECLRSERLTVTVLIAAGIPPGVCLYLSDRIRGLP